MVLAVCASVCAQSTQALITGRVTNRATGEPIAGARVCYENIAANVQGARDAAADGRYTVPLLPPGTYRVSAGDPGTACGFSRTIAPLALASTTPPAAPKYQTRLYDSLELGVAAVLEVNFELRPLGDVFDRHLFRSVPGGQEVTFYGPDADTSRAVAVEPLRTGEGRLEASISTTIDPILIDNLPLAGRDIYAAMLFQGGVNADPSALRGLGFTVNGQRESSSQFLLDGVDNNDYLISGPLNTLTPEAVQEYRVSVNNFSAEFGGTSGYVANAITRAGGSAWHGTAYTVFMNDALNANGFQENCACSALGTTSPRPPLKEAQPGFQIGGPAWRRSIFTSGAFEYTRVRTRDDPQPYQLPTAATFTSSGSSIGAGLLRQYPASAAPAGPAGTAATIALAAPSSLNQYLGFFRVDGQTPREAHHFFFRLADTSFDRPDFYWTPYPAFVSGFRQTALNLAAGASSNLSPRAVNEARVAWSRDLLRLDDNSNGLPELIVTPTIVPSSTSPFAYRNLGRTWQVLDNITITRGKSLFKAGGGVSTRTLDGYLRNGADGEFVFQNLQTFLSDEPIVYHIDVARNLNASAPLASPNYNRTYRYTQYFGFVQDSWRPVDGWMFSFGLRYEWLGAPENTGSQKDLLVALGSGTNMPAALAGAAFATPPSGNQQLYSNDPHDWAPRFGFSWLPYRESRFVIRGSYGVFYDRPYDNLWQTVQNNAVEQASANCSPCFVPVNYLAQARAGLASFPNLLVNGGRNGPQPTLFQPGLRNGMLQSAFVGVETRVNSAVAVSVNAVASRARGLETTDFVNRDDSVTPAKGNGFGSYAPNLPPLTYRANQGFENYAGLNALVRAHWRGIEAQAAYTWSHAIDNQSEPLIGDFSLEFASTVAGAGADVSGRPTFIRQFDSNVQTGSSDFDERHNFVFLAVVPLPASRAAGWTQPLLRDWQVSAAGTVHSGMPFSAFAFDNSPTLFNVNADVIDPAHARLDHPVPVTGGEQILNPVAFRAPAPGTTGTSGRNQFAGPGVVTTSLSLSRSVALSRSHESWRLTIRADAFNVLNHANLYVPFQVPLLGPGFGAAYFGTTGSSSQFPVQAPLTETPRQVQMSLRLRF